MRGDSVILSSNYTPTISKSQEDLLEVIRELMISNLQDQLSDLQWAEERGEITDQTYISFQAKRLNKSIERLERAYNPNEKIEY